jgi:hypothetical protein
VNLLQALLEHAGQHSPAIMLQPWLRALVSWPKTDLEMS